MYFDGAVEDEASVTTKPSTDHEQSRVDGQDTGRRFGDIFSGGRRVGQEMGDGRGEGMGSGYGQDTGSGLGQGGPSGPPGGLPDDVGKSDGMLC